MKYCVLSSCSFSAGGEASSFLPLCVKRAKSGGRHGPLLCCSLSCHFYVCDITEVTTTKLIKLVFGKLFRQRKKNWHGDVIRVTWSQRRKRQIIFLAKKETLTFSWKSSECIKNVFISSREYHHPKRVDFLTSGHFFCTDERPRISLHCAKYFWASLQIAASVHWSSEGSDCEGEEQDFFSAADFSSFICWQSLKLGMNLKAGLKCVTKKMSSYWKQCR